MKRTQSPPVEADARQELRQGRRAEDIPQGRRGLWRRQRSGRRRRQMYRPQRQRADQ